MMKLNLKQKLKDIKGNEITDEKGDGVKLGEIMANAIISNPETNDAAKNYVLATKFYQDEEFTFTAEELEYVKSEIKKVKSFPILYKGQLLTILDKVDKTDDKKKA